MRSVTKFFAILLMLAVPCMVALFTLIPVLFAILPTFLPFIAIFGLVHLLNKERRRGQEGGQRDMEDNVCPYCGKPVSEKSIICNHCFEDLAVNCPHCGKIVSVQANNCPRCGNSLLTKVSV